MALFLGRSLMTDKVRVRGKLIPSDIGKGDVIELDSPPKDLKVGDEVLVKMKVLFINETHFTCETSTRYKWGVTDIDIVARLEDENMPVGKMTRVKDTLPPPDSLEGGEECMCERHVWSKGATTYTSTEWKKNCPIHGKPKECKCVIPGAKYAGYDNSANCPKHGNSKVECEHPHDAIKWNPWNEVTQCHKCGHTIAKRPENCYCPPFHFSDCPWHSGASTTYQKPKDKS